jgi:thiosulfate reductase cytochrome b subunit
MAFFVTMVRRLWFWAGAVAFVVSGPYAAVQLIRSLADTAWADVAIYANLLASVAVMILVVAREAREQRTALDASAEVRSRSVLAWRRVRWINASVLILVSALILHGVSVLANRLAFEVVASAALLGAGVCFAAAARINRQITD